MFRLIELRFSTIRCLLVFVCLFLGVNASADLLDEQHLLYSSNMDAGQYRLALGAQQKINSRWHAEREEILAGKIQKRTFELHNEFQNIDEVWEALSVYFQINSARVLYSCEGLACGSSNAWANNQFGVKQLYGLDQQQRYIALKMNDSDISFRVIYLVQRGNRRMYLQVEEVVSSGPVPNLAPSANVIIDDLETKGYFAFELPKTYSVSGEDKALGIDEAFISTLIDALQKKPFLKLYVVGHSTRGHGSAERGESGKRIAEIFKAILVSKGVRENRLQIYSAADAMPRVGFGADRIELVLQKRR